MLESMPKLKWVGVFVLYFINGVDIASATLKLGVEATSDESEDSWHVQIFLSN